MISRWIRRRVVLLVAGVAVAVVALGGVAWAYWTAQATNVPAYSMADTVGAGARPSVNASGNTVTVSWSAAATAGGHAVGGYLVSRYPTASGGSAVAAAQGTCAATPVTATSCTETDVPGGTWYYTVTPVLGNWHGTESPRANAIDTTDTFVLALPGGTTTLTAGGATTLTLTATDGGRTDTGYAGTRTLTFAGPGTSPNGTVPSYDNGNPSVTFTGGVATMPMTLYRAENPTLTVTASNATGGIGLTVGPGAASWFAVTAPATAAAGAAQQVSVTAQDAYGNTATGYGGGRTLTWSGLSTSPGGKAPSYPANPVTFTGGVATELSIVDYDAQATTLTVGDGSISGTSASFTVTAGGLAQFAIAQAGAQTSGVAFAVTVTAQDAYGNTTNTGTTSLAFSGPGTAPDGSTPTYPAGPVTFANGTATVSITLVKAESVGLHVSNGTVSGQTPGTITVDPGTAANLAWASVSAGGGTLGSCLFTCSATGMNGQTFTAAVSVTDTHGNVAGNIGTAQTVTVKATAPTGGKLGSFTAPSSGTTVTLTIPATGAAVSTHTLAYAAPNGSGSWTTNTLTATGSYATATATLGR